ncbi:uncharacterized protein BT62DRAFT_1008613 [Guyanagaster necrorhizus]|uniref:Uncharacterized protein n=1 Tax=Guyanagaster necrorhizus TaxID=856835 RepID=A0A9P8ARJ6_9AGAR|nr:uncharacterized protein BT62DRAFT_1008613 [Guyanagaster necrorhizus MCA 3950]KAG7443932.1 hypothetical protein BT62DRAFT_1008613 [Guyanagaster necrorhizus MCA 3950]
MGDPALKPPFSSLNITDTIIHTLSTLPRDYCISRNYVYDIPLPRLRINGRRLARLATHRYIPDPEIGSRYLWSNSIGGLIFRQDRSDPIEVPLTFLSRQVTDVEILDCIPQLDDFFPRDKLACRRVAARGDDPPFELWYHKNGTQLGISANYMIASLTSSLEPRKIWYGPVIALILLRDPFGMKYTNFEWRHLDVFRRFFMSCPGPSFVS